MRNLPYRTNSTWLSDDDLILFDVIFARGTLIRLLRRRSFREQWNLGYNHNYTDAELKLRLRELWKHRVIEVESRNNRTYLRMTAEGGRLWSEERCPVWERFCTERIKTTSQGRSLMSVVAVSPGVRDDYLRVWSPKESRRRVTAICNFGLVSWRSFPTLHVGIATYFERLPQTPDEIAIYRQWYFGHQARAQNDRSWWRSVPELQRFITKEA